MTQRLDNIRFGFPLLFVVLFLAVSAAAQTYKLETFKAPPPHQLAPAVRATLASEAIRVTGPEGPLCELWLRKTVPAKASAAPELGILYPQLADGTLVGAIRFLSDVKDYRNQRVQPGVYTLRYALHPVDGDHMGVAPQRDFLLLAPATADPKPAPLSPLELLARSRQVSGTGHPSVWSLVETEGEAGSLPALVHWEEDDHWVLEFRVHLQPENGSPSPLVMGLVLVGQSPEA